MSERPGADEQRGVRRTLVHGFVRALLIPASVGIGVALLILGLSVLSRRFGGQVPASLSTLAFNSSLVLWPASVLYLVLVLGAMGGGGVQNLLPVHALLVALNGLLYGALGIVVQVLLAAVPAATRPGGWALRWKVVLAGALILEICLGLYIRVGVLGAALG